jgi:dihydroorotate dehydrogenase electron transfer subunit
VIRAVGRVVQADARRAVVDVPGWPGHRPGQFAMLGLDPHGLRHDPLLPRPMALYRGRGERLEFRFKPVGRGTRLLGALAPGAELGVVGPLGNGFEPADARAILVGGGTGIASLYELAANAPAGLRVLLGGRTRDDILGLDDFAALPIALEIATEDGSLGARGLVTERLAPRAGDTVYACGPTPMMRRCAELAAASGARCLASLESHMACGYGVCLGCAVPTRDRFRYVCTHGPVFDAATLVWENVP